MEARWPVSHRVFYAVCDECPWKCAGISLVLLSRVTLSRWNQLFTIYPSQRSHFRAVPIFSHASSPGLCLNKSIPLTTKTQAQSGLVVEGPHIATADNTAFNLRGTAIAHITATGNAHFQSLHNVNGHIPASGNAHFCSINL